MLASGERSMPGADIVGTASPCEASHCLAKGCCEPRCVGLYKALLSLTSCLHKLLLSLAQEVAAQC